MVPAGNYDEYFGMATDVEAVVYLMLMNTMIHDYFPTAITIGEDVSGMPTFCRQVFFLLLYYSCVSTNSSGWQRIPVHSLPVACLSYHQDYARGFRMSASLCQPAIRATLLGTDMTVEGTRFTQVAHAEL